jgi:putative ABC transport system permease protein
MMRMTFASPRWLKLVRDLAAERNRMLMMLAAVAVSVAALGAVLGAYSVLTREIAVNYLGTHPASATLELPSGVDEDALRIARDHPGIEWAQAHDVVQARVRVGDDWRPLLLFVVDDFSAMRLNTFRPVRGAWPPPLGTMLIERTATGVLAADVGGQLEVKTPNGAMRKAGVSGVVHDPGLAPAWQERSGYGYITRATLATFGEAPQLHELRFSTRDANASMPAIESLAASLATQLQAAGHAVHEVRVPPPRQHPHQRQMTTVLFLMLAFSAMALVLSGVLVATALSALLARQVREIGMMKAVGARTSQIAAMYAVLVSVIGLAALALAMPIGILGARVLAGAVSRLLNFTLTSQAIPHEVWVVQIVAALLVPLVVAAYPILRASRISTRLAMDSHGVSAEVVRTRPSAMPWPVRNALRRPGRLALTVALMAAGGAMFMTALNVSASWERTVAKVYETRHYDVEVRFHRPESPRLAEQLRQLPGVRAVEAWGYSPAAFAQPGQVDVVRTYPDRAHASLAMMAPPPQTRLVTLPVIAGRWLRSDDTNAIVLNHAAAAQAPALALGSDVVVSIEGRQSTWRVVGIVEEIGAAGVLYVSDRAFAQAAGTGQDARMLRVATVARTPAQREEFVRAVQRKLFEIGAGVEGATPLAELRTAMADHILILIRSLVAMAAVMATVGGLGLASTMGTSVLERTRELAVMKAVGATPGRIVRLLMLEALFIGGLSWLAAFALSVPLTWVVDALVGRLGFVAPLPLLLAPAAASIWLGLSGALVLLATAWPARWASRLPVAQALAQV